MYYRDLSVYRYNEELTSDSVRNVGWLSQSHGYAQGDVPEAFVERLWIFCRSSVLPYMGFHQCPFCEKDMGFLSQRGDETMALGSAEVWALGRNGMLYAAPNLIYHYITEHHYRPPEEFIQAIMEGPLPPEPYTDEYFEFGAAPNNLAHWQRS